MFKAARPQDAKPLVSAGFDSPHGHTVNEANRGRIPGGAPIITQLITNSVPTHQKQKQNDSNQFDHRSPYHCRFRRVYWLEPLPDF